MFHTQIILIQFQIALLLISRIQCLDDLQDHILDIATTNLNDEITNEAPEISQILTDCPLKSVEQSKFRRLVDSIWSPFIHYARLFRRYYHWINSNADTKKLLSGDEYERKELLSTLQLIYAIEENKLRDKLLCTTWDDSIDADHLTDLDTQSEVVDGIHLSSYENTNLSRCSSIDFVLEVASNAIDRLESVEDLVNNSDIIQDKEDLIFDPESPSILIDESMRRLKKIILDSAINRIKLEAINIASMSIKMVTFYAVSKLFEEASAQQVDLFWPMIVSRFCRYDFNIARKYAKSLRSRVIKSQLKQTVKTLIT